MCYNMDERKLDMHSERSQTRRTRLLQSHARMYGKQPQSQKQEDMRMFFCCRGWDGGERGSCCSVDVEFPSWGMDVLNLRYNTVLTSSCHTAPSTGWYVSRVICFSPHWKKHPSILLFKKKLVSGVISMVFKVGETWCSACLCSQNPGPLLSICGGHTLQLLTHLLFEQNHKTPGAAQTHVRCQRNTLLF